MNLSRLHVAPEEQIPRVQIVYSACPGGVRDYPPVLTGRAQSPYRAILREQKLQNGGVLGTTFVLPVKDIARRAVTGVRAVSVLA